MVFARILILLLVATLAGCSSATLLNATADRSGLTIERGLSYGPLPRQRYDVYRPRDAQDAPVVVFVYGGSWESGERSTYAFVGNALAQAGFVAVVPDYRVYPQVKFPDFVRDAAKAVAYASRKEAAGRPVFVMGHSAGAQIAALVALDRRYLRAEGTSPCRIVAGLIGLAGPYDFLPLTNDRYRRIFPEALRKQSQPVNFARGSHPPALLLHGTGDYTVEAEDSRVLAAALRRSGNEAELKLYRGLGHAAIVGALAGPLQRRAPVMEDVVAFVREEVRAGYPRCG